MSGAGRAPAAGAVLAVGRPGDAPDTPRPYITHDETTAWARLPADTRIVYGPAERNFGELRLPSGDGPHPVAVVIHGGCWLSIADHAYMTPVARALTEAGWATWNLEFRTLDQEGGAWPGIFRDVAAGVDHLRAVAREHSLDLERVVTLGHSSGGHLALWAASRHRVPPGRELYRPDPLPVRGTVGLAAIADLEHYHAMGLEACGDTPTRLLGGTPPPRAPERVAQASPAALRPTGVPQLLLTGVDDYAVPPEHGEAYAASAQEAGQEATHHVIAAASHFELVAPWTEPWQVAWGVLGPFLERMRQ